MKGVLFLLMARLRRPIRVNPFSRKVMRARFSLQETQTEFAARLRVKTPTIYAWESGRIRHPHKIYEDILDSIVAELKAQDRLLPEEIINTFLRQSMEKRGSVYV